MRSKVFGRTNIPTPYPPVHCLRIQNYQAAPSELFNSKLGPEMIQMLSKSFSCQNEGGKHIYSSDQNLAICYVKPLLHSHVFEEHMFSEQHLLYKCHLVANLPARRVPWKLLVLSWNKGKGMKVTAYSKVPRWLLCHSPNEPFDRLQHQDSIVISWGELLADRCLRITLIGTSCHR